MKKHMQTPYQKNMFQITASENLYPPNYTPQIPIQKYMSSMPVSRNLYPENHSSRIHIENTYIQQATTQTTMCKNLDSQPGAGQDLPEKSIHGSTCWLSKLDVVLQFIST